MKVFKVHVFTNDEQISKLIEELRNEDKAKKSKKMNITFEMHWVGMDCGISLIELPKILALAGSVHAKKNELSSGNGLSLTGDRIVLSPMYMTNHWKNMKQIDANSYFQECSATNAEPIQPKDAIIMNAEEALRSDGTGNPSEVRANDPADALVQENAQQTGIVLKKTTKMFECKTQTMKRRKSWRKSIKLWLALRTQLIARCAMRVRLR